MTLEDFLLAWDFLCLEVPRTGSLQAQCDNVAAVAPLGTSSSLFSRTCPRAWKYANHRCPLSGPEKERLPSFLDVEKQAALSFLPELPQTPTTIIHGSQQGEAWS